jgi:hypothetical protein
MSLFSDTVVTILMNIPFLNFIFKNKTKKLKKIDSIIIKKIKQLSNQSEIEVYSNIDIYHHHNSYNIALLVIDPKRGIYIFEIKNWSYNELKDAKVQKAKNLSNDENTLAYDKTREIIEKKFNEITHNDGVSIFNYLIMENLSSEEYNNLDDTFKNLLPKNKIIFNDTNTKQIENKLQEIIPRDDFLYSKEEIIGTLLIQYALFDQNMKLHICNKQQIEFINLDLTSLTILNGESKSGKSTILLLKSIVELFNNPTKKIMIIQPTVLASDILKKRLLELVEHAIIEIDLTSIEILSAYQLLNKHREKLNILKSESLNIDNLMLKKRFNATDILMCDDSYIYESEFINYLRHIQKKDKLVLVNSKIKKEDINLTHSYQRDRKIEFYENSSYPKAMHILSKFVNDEKRKILLVANNSNTQNLQEDLKHFIKDDIKFIDGSKHFIDQEFENIIFATYNDINLLTPKHTILMDLCSTSENKIKYALNLAQESVTILYDEECSTIKNIRDEYESH